MCVIYDFFCCFRVCVCVHFDCGSAHKWYCTIARAAYSTLYNHTANCTLKSHFPIWLFARLFVYHSASFLKCLLPFRCDHVYVVFILYYNYRVRQSCNSRKCGLRFSFSGSQISDFIDFFSIALIRQQLNLICIENDRNIYTQLSDV